MRLIIISCFLILSVFGFGCKKTVSEGNIIPKPNKSVNLPGSVLIKDSIAVKVLDNRTDALEIAVMLEMEFNKFSGIKAFIADGNFTGEPALYLSINPESGALGDEGYVLIIRNDSILIQANAAPGLFYATRSLLQIASSCESQDNSLILKNCIINDYPRYPWRGMHLDVSRHFFPKKFILKYLDAMALHKLNVFHWHLSDDQGWRVEIKKYPELTELGAWREDNTDKEWSYFQYPTNDSSKKLYGGFYTHDDIREIVRYAAIRNITIVPEIDVPGHSTAAIYAYPELSCSKQPWIKNPLVPFEFSDPMCAGNEFTYKFLEDVFSELCELFPGPYFHIGGDECKHIPWETCSKCQARMTENNIKDVKELQSYFNRQLESILLKKHKRLIGWEEIADGTISPTSILMSWKGEEAGIIAARNRLQVIMVPSNYLYFDSYPDDLENQNSNNYNSLEHIYSYNPDPAILGPADYRSIYGVQAALWTENVTDEVTAEKMTYPRLCGLSEVAWTMPENKNYQDFFQRLMVHYDFLDKAQISYFIQMPGSVGNEIVFTHKIRINLTNEFGKGKIYMTTDGTEPGIQSQVYSKPLSIDQSGLLKAKVIVSDALESKTRICKISKQTFMLSQQVSGEVQGLKVNYSEGIIDSLTHWNELKFVLSDTISAFSIPSFARPDSFGLEFEGLIRIPDDGIYSFSIASDDGTWLYINDSLLVNNDGCHGPSEVGKQIALEAGYHKIKLLYFEALYGNELSVFIEGDNIPHKEISSSMLYRLK